jgi:integrase
MLFNFKIATKYMTSLRIWRFKKMEQAQSTAMITAESKEIRNSSANLSKIIKTQGENSDVVSYLKPSDIKLMVCVAKQNKRQWNGDRNAVLIETLYDACLRISEALSLRPVDIQRTNAGYLLCVLGKGNRPGLCAISASTVADLKSYILDYHIADGDRIFDISRSGAFREIQNVYKASGVRMPSVIKDGVGLCHILRHSGCLARLAISGNPREIQTQLRHRSPSMTLRYMKTLSVSEALRNQQQVNVWQEG